MTRPPGAQAKRAPAGRGTRSALNLIHRNNSPKPAFMRVCGRFAPPLLRSLRAGLYAPVHLIPHLPGGPLRWLWIARVVVTLDAPLRRASASAWRALNAKSG